jgi:hypothetical protein
MKAHMTLGCLHRDVNDESMQDWGRIRRHPRRGARRHLPGLEAGVLIRLGTLQVVQVR